MMSTLIMIITFEHTISRSETIVSIRIIEIIQRTNVLEIIHNQLNGLHI